MCLSAITSPAIAIFGAGPEVFDRAARFPFSHIAIFVPSWDDVEQVRLLAEARRLDHRVSVHHESAARAARGFPIVRPAA